MGKKKNKKFQSNYSGFDAERIQEILSRANLDITGNDDASWEEDSYEADVDTNANTEEYNQFVNAKFGNKKSKGKNKHDSKKDFVLNGKEIDRAIARSVNTDTDEDDGGEDLFAYGGPAPEPEKVATSSIYGKFDVEAHDYTNGMEEADEEAAIPYNPADFYDPSPIKPDVHLQTIPDYEPDGDDLDKRSKFFMCSEFVSLKYMFIPQLRRLTLMDGVSSISLTEEVSQTMPAVFDISEAQYIQALMELCCDEVEAENGESKIVFSEENFVDSMHTFQKFVIANMHPCAVYTEEEFQKTPLAYATNLDKRAIRVFYDANRKNPLYYVYYTSGEAQKNLDRFVRECASWSMSDIRKTFMNDKIKAVFEDVAEDDNKVSLIRNKLRRLNVWVFLAHFVSEAFLFNADNVEYVETFRTLPFTKLIEDGNAQDDGNDHSGELAFNMKDIFEEMLKNHEKVTIDFNTEYDEEEAIERLNILDYCVIVEKAYDMLEFIREANEREESEEAEETTSTETTDDSDGGLDLNGPEDGMNYDELEDYLKTMVGDYSDDETPLADIVRATSQVDTVAGELYKTYCENFKKEHPTETPKSFEDWLDDPAFSELLSASFSNVELGEEEDEEVPEEVPVPEAPVKAPVEKPVEPVPEKVSGEVVNTGKPEATNEGFGNAQMMDALTGINFEGLTFPPIRKRGNVK